VRLARVNVLVMPSSVTRCYAPPSDVLETAAPLTESVAGHARRGRLRDPENPRAAIGCQRPLAPSTDLRRERARGATYDVAVRSTGRLDAPRAPRGVLGSVAGSLARQRRLKSQLQRGRTTQVSRAAAGCDMCDREVHLEGCGALKALASGSAASYRRLEHAARIGRCARPGMPRCRSGAEIVQRARSHWPAWAVSELVRAPRVTAVSEVDVSSGSSVRSAGRAGDGESPAT
jgi:hypothetical protein